MTGTVGMYGDLQGLVGASLPRIPALELDDRLSLGDGAED
jgi:hypothetical protein